MKDVILPGEIRELVNKVVEAERTGEGEPDPPPGGDRGDAFARSTPRSGWRITHSSCGWRREHESLERLVEKVGGIDLHTGDGQELDALLTRLVRLKSETA